MVRPVVGLSHGPVAAHSLAVEVVAPVRDVASADHVDGCARAHAHARAHATDIAAAVDALPDESPQSAGMRTGSADDSTKAGA